MDSKLQILCNRNVTDEKLISTTAFSWLYKLSHQAHNNGKPYKLLLCLQNVETTLNQSSFNINTDPKLINLEVVDLKVHNGIYIMILEKVDLKVHKEIFIMVLEELDSKVHNGIYIMVLEEVDLKVHLGIYILTLEDADSKVQTRIQQDFRGG